MFVEVSTLTSKAAMTRCFKLCSTVLLLACADTRDSGNVDAADTGNISDADRTTDTRDVSQTDVRLALDPDGLRFFDARSGSARLIPFGTSDSVVMNVLQTTEGAPQQRGENVECGVSYATWNTGLTIVLARDRFVGWSVRGNGGTLTTASGVGVGSTRAQLDSAHAARVFESSLGTEFTAGGLAGILESPRRDARILALWAGQVCIAR